MNRAAWVLALVACHRGGGGPNLLGDAPAAKPSDAAIAAVDAPPPVTKPTAVKLATGAHASCAVMSDATVRCWGANASGQLGDGTQRDSVEPVQPKLRGVKDLVAGDDTACALLDDGSVACWGRIGMGKPWPTLVPSAAPGVKNATRVFAIGAAACATIGEGGGPKGTPAGALVCWGDVDARGHFQHGTEHRVSAPVVGLDHVVALTPHAALLAGGDVAYWTDGGTPVRAGIGSAVEVASDSATACARLADGSVACFGAHAPCAVAPAAAPPTPTKPKSGLKSKSGKGKKPAKPAPPPAPKSEPTKLALTGARELALGAGICVVTTAGKMQCLDPSDGCKLEAPWLANIVDVSGQCARLAGGKVECWRLEGRSRTSSAIADVTGATQLSATADRGCALVPAGVTCWERGSRAAPVSFP